MPKLAARATTLLLLGLTALLVWDLPLHRVAIAVGLVTYAGLIWRYPLLWLVAVPAALPLLDLSPWTGRLLIEEYDLLVLTTIAVGLWRLGAGEGSRLSLGGRTLLALFAGLTLVSAYLGYESLKAGVDETSLVYFLPENALRVAKGLFLALGLLPCLAWALHENRERALARLTDGFQLGLLGLGVIALWERGVFHAMANDGMLKALDVLMNFGGSYRLTGLFSGMHTGGEAIDGYLVVALPMAIYGVVRTPSLHRRAWGTLVLGLGVYTLLTTFTRATYMASALSVVFMGILAAYLLRAQIARHWPAPLDTFWCLAILTLLAFVVRTVAGYQALVASVLAVWAIVVCALLTGRGRGLVLVGLATLLSSVFAAYHIFDDMRENTQVAYGFDEAMLYAVSIALLVATVTVLLIRRGIAHSTPVNGLTLLAAVSVVWLVGVPVAGGFTVAERLSSTSSDFHTRLTHWRNVLETLDGGPRVTLLGNGVGTFPLRYHLSFGESRFPLSYRLLDELGEPALQIDPGPLSLLQRTAAEPGVEYRLSVVMRSTPGSVLRASLCPRNLLYFGHMPCRGRKLVNSEPAIWEEREVELVADPRGLGGPLGWPHTLKLDAGIDKVDIASIRLLDSAGNDLLRNGSFADGLDHWFLVSNYSHLPWHTKNNYLHVLVEQGYLGLLGFVLLIIAALIHSLTLVGRGDPLGVLIAGSLTGFVLVGIFGSPLDMPRVAMLFYLTLGLAFVKLPVAQALVRPGAGAQRVVATHSEPLPTWLAQLAGLVRMRESGGLSTADFEQAKQGILDLREAGESRS